jgi:ATP-dependent helicase/DNAse subunit B
MQDRISALRDDLDDLGWTTSPMTKTEDAARKAFFSLLDRLSAAGTAHAPCSLSDFYSNLSRGCRKNAGIPYPENETAFRVGKLRSAAGTKTPYVFIIGLSSKSIPNISATLPLLTVQETKDLLPNRYRKSAEDTAYYFEAACASASKKLTLSYAESDIGTTFSPSPLLTRIGEPKKAEAGNPVHSVFGCQKTAGICAAEQKEIDEAFGISDINDTAYRICSYDLGPSFEDGRFSEIYSERKSFSPTFLESYAKCPFSWYIKHHLSLENPSDFSSEPIKIGNVIHKVLERYFSVHDCITEENADLAYEELCRMTVEEMEKTGIKTPSWKAKELGYLGCDVKDSSLKKLIEIEAAFAKEGYRTEAAWLEREVEGEFDGIKISGRADRVIMKENGEFMVLDYKTGSKVETNPKKALQIPIYSEAIRQMTGGTPAVGNFINITDDTAKLIPSSKDCADDMISKTKERVAEIIELVKSGKIGYGDKCPNFCPYKHICRKAEVKDD